VPPQTNPEPRHPPHARARSQTRGKPGTAKTQTKTSHISPGHLTNRTPNQSPSRSVRRSVTRSPRQSVPQSVHLSLHQSLDRSRNDRHVDLYDIFGAGPYHTFRELSSRSHHSFTKHRGCLCTSTICQDFSVPLWTCSTTRYSVASDFVSHIVKRMQLTSVRHPPRSVPAGRSPPHPTSPEFPHLGHIGATPPRHKGHPPPDIPRSPRSSPHTAATELRGSPHIGLDRDRRGREILGGVIQRGHQSSLHSHRG
jgi:hypothetical protein